MKTLLKVSAMLAAGTFMLPSIAGTTNHDKSLHMAMSSLNATKPDMSKVSYIVGYQVGHGFATQKLGIVNGEFLKGYNAAIHGSHSAYTKAQAEQIMKQFQTFMMSKMAKKAAQKADKNGRASAAFIQKISNQKGVKKIAKGVYYRQLKSGHGAIPKSTDTVTVNYVGSLANHKVFDSSYKRHKPLTIGVSQVIPGWKKALEKMPVGSTWVLYLSPDQAYGKFAPPSIGPNQALIFKISLLSIEHKKS